MCVCVHLPYPSDKNTPPDRLCQGCPVNMSVNSKQIINKHQVIFSVSNHWICSTIIKILIFQNSTKVSAMPQLSEKDTH